MILGGNVTVVLEDSPMSELAARNTQPLTIHRGKWSSCCPPLPRTAPYQTDVESVTVEGLPSAMRLLRSGPFRLANSHARRHPLGPCSLSQLWRAVLHPWHLRNTRHRLPREHRKLPIRGPAGPGFSAAQIWYRAFYPIETLSAVAQALPRKASLSPQRGKYLAHNP